MKRVVFPITACLLFLSSLAAPLWAHGVLVPLPRNPNPGVLEYKVKILATNQGSQTRRFQVAEVIPEPSEPPADQPLADVAVPARAVGIFEMPAVEGASGLLRVTGAPQMVIGALLEVRENGELLDTVNLPVIAAPEEDDHSESGIVRHGSFDHVAHLQGLALSRDGRATTDFAVVSLNEEESAECTAEFFTAEGSGLARIPTIISPIGAAALFDQVFEALVLPEDRSDRENVRVGIKCTRETFYAWAAVYHDHGRDVAFVTPSVSVR